MKKLHRNLQLKAAGALCALLLLFAGCERNATPALQQIGWEYYPMALGQYRLFDAYQIKYNFASENDTLAYELKELVADYFLNQENDTVYILHRFHRSTVDAAWQLDSAYTVQRTPRWVVQSANNRPLLQLLFPVGEGLTWNANLLNAAPPDSFSIAALAQPFEGAYLTFDRSLQVVQENIDDTIVETDQRLEVYASDVGMVYKRTKNINYCTNPDCLGQNIINSGLFLELHLKEYGIEPQ